MPVVPAEGLQLGHHGIPVPGDEAARPYGPGETDRVEPLEPVRYREPPASAGGGN